MNKRLAAISLVGLSLTATLWAQNIGKPTPIPPATSTRPHESYKENLSATKPGEVVVTFEKADLGHPAVKFVVSDVTFQLGWALRQSQAEPRVMFFPHEMTGNNGILNAMATEQAIPVKATLPVPASSVTLVMWGTTDSPARVEAHDKNDKLLDTVVLEKVPERLDPDDPIPSFEISVKGDNIAYVLFGGAPNGGYIAAEKIRYMPMSPTTPAQPKPPAPATANSATQESKPN